VSGLAIYTALASRSAVVPRTVYARSTIALSIALGVTDAGPCARRAPWRFAFWCCLAYALVIAAWSAPSPTSSDTPAQSEQSIKAAFLYKFLSYVDWRAGAFAAPASPIVIAVMGAEDIADALDVVAGGRKVGEHPVEIRRVRPNDPLEGVHMLFVGREHSTRTRQMAAVAQRRGVLLVTDYEGALDDGSAINLVVVENRVRFEVSLDAAERSGLKLSSRMLSVALWVRPAS
jgi:uncharacterized protein DUF4154